MPDETESRSPTTIPEKLVKIGTKLVVYARYAVFDMVEVAVPRDMFRRILDLSGEPRPWPAAPMRMANRGDQAKILTAEVHQESAQRREHSHRNALSGGKRG